MRAKVPKVLALLDRLHKRRVWPNGARYLWTDAFGVVLLVSLFRRLGDPSYLRNAADVVAEVDRVLGRERGLRIGQAPEREGQYFHYIAMWVFALMRLGEIEPAYTERAIRIVKDVHPRFVVPGTGVFWKMKEDLSGPYPGSGWGALDAYHGYVVYRLLAPKELAKEIGEMGTIIDQSWRSLDITQDLALGMMLWIAHFFPHERWAIHERRRALAILERMWVDPPGYFCRQPFLRDTKYAFTNYGISIGLQATHAHLERVEKLHDYFEAHEGGDEYVEDAITHVMACCAYLPGELLWGPRTLRKSGAHAW
jgi:hypothetical protein